MALAEQCQECAGLGDEGVVAAQGGLAFGAIAAMGRAGGAGGSILTLHRVFPPSRGAGGRGGDRPGNDLVQHVLACGLGHGERGGRRWAEDRENSAGQGARK